MPKSVNIIPCNFILLVFHFGLFDVFFTLSDLWARTYAILEKSELVTQSGFVIQNSRERGRLGRERDSEVTMAVDTMQWEEVGFWSLKHEFVSRGLNENYKDSWKVRVMAHLLHASSLLGK